MTTLAINSASPASVDTQSDSYFEQAREIVGKFCLKVRAVEIHGNRFEDLGEKNYHRQLKAISQKACVELIAMIGVCSIEKIRASLEVFDYTLENFKRFCPVDRGCSKRSFEILKDSISNATLSHTDQGCKSEGGVAAARSAAKVYQHQAGKGSTQSTLRAADYPDDSAMVRILLREDTFEKLKGFYLCLAPARLCVVEMNPELGKKYEKERNAWYAAFNKRTTTEQSPEWNRVPRAEHLLFNLDFVSGGALVTVPNGISRADVLIGLWKYAWPTCWCDDETNIQKALQNRAKIEQDLLKNPRVMEYEGRSIEVDFSKFPELNLAAYVVDHSRGLSAKGIIELIAEETTSPSSAQKKAPAKAPTTPPHPNSGQTSAGQKSNLQKSTERTNK